VRLSLWASRGNLLRRQGWSMKDRYILAIDQGTSATKTVIFDSAGQIAARASASLASSFPRPGFVEQDPEAIYRSVLDSVGSCLDSFRGRISDDFSRILACGISNQRETFILWDRKGTPLAPAVVWQCKRSVDICERLRSSGIGEEIRERTGLLIDPYFSATKLIWLAENERRVRKEIDSGRAFFGTVDAWLAFRLTGGKTHATDHTNASRTLLFNITQLDWDRRLLAEWHLEGLRLPEVHPSSYFYGETDFDGLLPTSIPISAMIGDSHAAAFGEQCLTPGTAKATMGTGSSIMMNVGQRRLAAHGAMVSTICFSMKDRVDYALEGIVVSCGATIAWLRDQLGMLVESRDSESMAREVPDNGGVYLVPAFSGLGAPWWKMDLRAAIMGLTFGSTKNHIVRAALESIPYQIAEVIAAMEADSLVRLTELKVDGGITENNFVMQFLADLLPADVVSNGVEDVSALGAAGLAGLEAGLYPDLDALAGFRRAPRRFTAGPQSADAKKCQREWKKAVTKLL
jgi:glycerol kinase